MEDSKISLDVSMIPMINPLASRSCHYTVARKTIFRVLGNPNDLGNSPCDAELEFQVYGAKKIDWKFYTNKIKLALIRNLYNEFPSRGKKEYPKQKNIRALREVLNDLFPDLFGFGKLYDESKFTDAYQTNRKRAPKPWPYQDSVFWSLSARLDQENMSRRSSIKR